MQTQEDVERMLHLLLLGMIPLVKRNRLSRKPPQDYALDKPASAYSQAVKSLFTSLIIAHQRKGTGNIVPLTPAVPGEGKLALVATLARVTAIAGRRVLIVDCDLRRPNIHRALSLPNQNGLARLPQRQRNPARRHANRQQDRRRRDHRRLSDRQPRGDHPEPAVRSDAVQPAPPVRSDPAGRAAGAAGFDTRILAEKASQCVVVVKGAARRGSWFSLPSGN